MCAVPSYLCYASLVKKNLVLSQKKMYLAKRVSPQKFKDVVQFFLKLNEIKTMDKNQASILDIMIQKLLTQA